MSYLGGSPTNTNIMPGRGLINPAFIIKIVPATDDMQQQVPHPRNNPKDDYLSNIAIGDSVQAKKKDQIIDGRVHRLVKNAIGDVIKVIVIDNEGKIHEIEASSIKTTKKFKKEDDDDDALISSPAVYNESKFLDFNQFNKI